MRRLRISGSLWSHRDFMRLWVGQSVSLIGSNVSYLALPLTALMLLQATPFQIGIITMMSGLPYLLVSLPAGVIVDRSRKRTVLMVCDVGRALTLASVPAMALLDLLTIEQMYVVAAVSATLSVFFDAAYMGFPATLLERDQLVEANAKISTSISLAQAVGPALGGVLVGVLGAVKAVTVDALSYAFSAATLRSLRHREEKQEPVDRSASQFWKELLEGLRLVATDPKQRALTISNSILNFCMVGATTIWLLYVVQDLHWSPAAAGLVLGISSVGGVIGSLFVKRLSDRYGLIRVMLISQIFYAPGELVVFFVRPGFLGQVVVTAGFSCLMFATVVYASSQQSFRQLSCPKELLGRMNASVRWLQWGLRPLAGVLAGALATQASVRSALLVFTLGLFVGPIVLWLSPIRSARNSPVLPPGIVEANAS